MYLANGEYILEENKIKTVLCEGFSNYEGEIVASAAKKADDMDNFALRKAAKH
jgi:hypothetical protein